MSSKEINLKNKSIIKDFLNIKKDNLGVNLNKT
jgi:hypothetical protein